MNPLELLPSSAQHDRYKGERDQTHPDSHMGDECHLISRRQHLINPTVYLRTLELVIPSVQAAPIFLARGCDPSRSMVLYYVTVS